MQKMDSINQKREAFRQQYSSIVFNAYVNTLMVCIIFTASLVFTTLKVNWTFTAILLVPVGFIWAEAMLYLTHRYQQHRKLRFLEPIYKMHTVWHHGMFSNDEMSVGCFKDMNMVMLPFFIHGFVLGLVYLPFAYLVEYIFGTNIGWLLMFCVTVHLIWYEIVHTISHIGSNVILRGLSQHHRHHHNPKLLGEYNFGIATTIFDKYFGTRYDH